MLAYDAAHAVARVVVGRGHTVVLECTYARTEQRASLLEALADTPETPLWAVELFVSPDEAVQRFRQRHDATDLDERLVRDRAARFPYSDQPLRLPSSAAGPDELARQVSEWWRRRPAGLRREDWAASGRGWD
jgi:predicted kinase